MTNVTWRVSNEDFTSYEEAKKVAIEKDLPLIQIYHTMTKEEEE